MWSYHCDFIVRWISYVFEAFLLGSHCWILVWSDRLFLRCSCWKTVGIIAKFLWVIWRRVFEVLYAADVCRPLHGHLRCRPWCWSEIQELQQKFGPDLWRGILLVSVYESFRMSWLTIFKFFSLVGTLIKFGLLAISCTFILRECQEKETCQTCSVDANAGL